MVHCPAQQQNNSFFTEMAHIRRKKSFTGELHVNGNFTVGSMYQFLIIRKILLLLINLYES
jgi:hypothetical protein